VGRADTVRRAAVAFGARSLSAGRYGADQHLCHSAREGAMDRYKVLKSVAHSLGHSFVSRMNYRDNDFVMGHPPTQARQTRQPSLPVADRVAAGADARVRAAAGALLAAGGGMLLAYMPLTQEVKNWFQRRYGD